MSERTAQIVTTKTDFDRRLRTDTALRDSIAGFTSISLTYIKLGLDKQGYSVPLFSTDQGGECGSRQERGVGVSDAQSSTTGQRIEPSEPGAHRTHRTPTSTARSPVARRTA